MNRKEIENLRSRKVSDEGAREALELAAARGVSLAEGVVDGVTGIPAALAELGAWVGAAPAEDRELIKRYGPGLLATMAGKIDPEWEEYVNDSVEAHPGFNEAGQWMIPGGIAAKGVLSTAGKYSKRTAGDNTLYRFFDPKTGQRGTGTRAEMLRHFASKGIAPSAMVITQAAVGEEVEEGISEIPR